MRRRSSFSGKVMSVIVAFSSLTRSPVILWMRSVILRRTSSTVWRMFLLYSIPILRSMAVSVLPTSTEIPLVLLSEPVRLPSTPPAVLEAPPPMLTPSTSCAAMPAIEETTVSLIIVAPRSLRSGLSPRCCPDSLISHSPPSTKFSRVFPERPLRNQNTSIRTAKTPDGWQGVDCNALPAILYLLRYTMVRASLNPPSLFV